MSKNFRHLKNVIMRNHLCNTLQLQVQLLLKQQYGSGYFAAKLISNDIAKRYAISLNLSLKNVFTYYIAYWILRDMLHSQSPYTYQPLDTFVNLMILMILVHQIWLKNSSFSLQTNTFYRIFDYPSPRQFYQKFRMSSYFEFIMFTNKAMFLLAFFGFLRIG